MGIIVPCGDNAFCKYFGFRQFLICGKGKSLLTLCLHTKDYGQQKDNLAKFQYAEI